MTNDLRCSKCGRFKSNDNHICRKHEYTEEQKKAMSERLKKAYREGTIKINSGTFQKGHKPTDEIKKKMSDSHIGQISWSKGKRIQTNTGRTHFKKGINVGEKNFNWKGGKVAQRKLLLSLPEYKKWREDIFIRDNYTCQKCKIKSGNGHAVKLNAHHIVSIVENPDLVFDTGNGMTLCRKCHVNYHKLNKFSDMPPITEDEVIKIEKNKCDEEFMDLQTGFGNYVAENIIVHNSTPSRRSEELGIYLPSQKKENINLAVAIDSSGSIDDKTLKTFLSHTRDVIASFQHITLTVLVCDCKIQSVHEFSHANINDINKIKLKGQGGTSFSPVFEHLAKNKPDVKLVIYLTDGEVGEKIKLGKYKGRVLWVLTKDGTDMWVKGTGNIIKMEE